MVVSVTGIFSLSMAPKSNTHLLHSFPTSVSPPIRIFRCVLPLKLFREHVYEDAVVFAPSHTGGGCVRYNAVESALCHSDTDTRRRAAHVYNDNKVPQALSFLVRLLYAIGQENGRRLANSTGNTEACALASIAAVEPGGGYEETQGQDKKESRRRRVKG